ncbi:MAG: pantoate--beta-alanine ligase [Anaerolineae bacterium]|jgi:pantoate--beta-alanine ligase|nr:pantoate--beta-alanine ligase [Anaerolineae bacterium]
MQVIDTLSELRLARKGLSGTIGLVPTMGALHAGHYALMEQARGENDQVIATIFINPLQFAPTEDLSTYPRDLPNDLKLLESAGVDLVFTPTPAIMYPADFQTAVEVSRIAQGLEGGQRPGHFRGVTTVVSKLFNLTQPDRAYFGQKDAQQVAVIRRMVYDLNFPLEVVVCPTVRAEDGLALSSRNAYLTSEQRQAAPVLYRAMRSAGDAYDQGERDPNRLRAILEAIVEAEPLADLEYASITNAQTLAELQQPTDQAMLLSMAVRIGRARLIDNLLLPLSLNDRSGLSIALANPEYQ